MNCLHDNLLDGPIVYDLTGEPQGRRCPDCGKVA